ncbi:lambda exonuclease family protein [Bacteroides reticulotermitis]|uniref:lambda exonuclease family protein n=1 Tax=Bacteroides reticulotermitis TaxID=1133319 RepID=UPI003A84DDF7
MIEQRTKDWKIQRLGNFTGSAIGKLMKSGRKKDETFGDTALSYIYQIASERNLKDIVVENDDVWQSYEEQTSAWSRAMQFGIDWEPDAKSEYIKHTGNQVEDAESISHETIPFFSASPDGIIYESENVGVLEIKCPSPAVFMKYRSEIKDNASLLLINPDYFFQTQAEMMVAKASFCDFVVFNPFMIDSIHVVRVIPDQSCFTQIERRIKSANDFIKEILK